MLQYMEEILKNGLFSGISRDELAGFLEFDTCTLAKYPRNSLIVQESEKCSSIGLLLEGTLSVQQLSAAGDTIILNYISKGESFGEGVLFSKDPLYRFSVLSMSSSVVLFIPLEQVKKLLEESSMFKTNYIAFLSDRLQLMKNKISILSRKDVRSRLLIYLSAESRKAGSLSFILPHTRTEIAEQLGVARPSIPRELLRMQKDRLIRLNGREVSILNPDQFSI